MLNIRWNTRGITPCHFRHIESWRCWGWIGCTASEKQMRWTRVRKLKRKLTVLIFDLYFGVLVDKHAFLTNYLSKTYVVLKAVALQGRGFLHTFWFIWRHFQKTWLWKRRCKKKKSFPDEWRKGNHKPKHSNNKLSKIRIIWYSDSRLSTSDVPDKRRVKVRSS